MNWQDALLSVKENSSRENLYNTARKLCASLTLNEKIGMLAGNNVKTVSSILNAVSHGKWVYNYTPWTAGGVKRLGIPAVAFTDGPRGVVMGQSTCFPVSTMRAASFDLELEKEVMQAIAEEALAQGANYFAGICINLLRNPRWGRAQESFGEDPFVLGEFGAADTRVMQQNGIMACPKHYACNSLENLRFEVNVHASKRTMYEVYLPHFKKCIDAGAASIMGAYNLFEGDQCCESKWLLTDVLRNEWGFDGFTLSDFFWGVHNGAKAIKAGLDIEMPFTLRYGVMLKAALKSGKITVGDINNSVESILRGMLLTLPNQKQFSKAVIESKEHLALSQKSAEEGTVLLKNDGILPLAAGSKIAVIGKYADKANTGDRGSSNVHSHIVVSPFKGIASVFGNAKVQCADGQNLQTALSLAKNADAVVAVVGLDYTNEGEYLINKKSDTVEFNGQGGDRKTMGISPADIALIEALAKVNKNLIVTLSGGSALIINEWEDKARAVLMSFYSGSMGGHALGNILAGKVNPSGKLPFSVAHNESDYPPIITDADTVRDIDYGYYHGYTLFDKKGTAVDYPFGFGLSYTRFEISGLSAEKCSDCVSVSADVKNTGSVAGAEVLQIYFGSTETAKDRPVKLLKGFKRVELAPGEKKRVTVSVPLEELRFYNEELVAWELDSEYTVFAGSDCKKAEELTVKITL